MVNMARTDLTWKGINSLNDERLYIESRFEKIYPFILENNEKHFLLPNEIKMHVVTMYWPNPSDNCLVMEYTDPGQEVFGVDGDCFYREDYETPNAMFQDMLKETED